MLPVCHGFGGKVPSYGEWKAGHQEEGLYCIYMWSVCGEVGRAEGELKEKLREEAGVGVCVSDRVLLCVSQYQPDRFRCLYG